MEVMCLKLKGLVRHDRLISGPTHTEFSVTLSYLKRINNKKHIEGNELLLQDFAESGIIQLDVRA
jgi:hypothetical protein